MNQMNDSRDDGRFEIRVSADRIEVYADIHPAKGQGKQVGSRDVIAELKMMGITTGIKTEKIEEYVTAVGKTNTIINNVLIAEGIKPVNGADAEAEFFFSTEQTFEDFKVLPDGRVDYRGKANIQNVHKGDMLARVGQPQEGKDGFDVYGTLLKCRNGTADVLCLGENVSVSADGRTFYAEEEGMLCLNGNIINVLKCYIVDGDVGFNVGNIEFNGNVVVKGGVHSGFEIKATGDITVFKDIESAIIISGRDIKVYGGIIGDSNSIINCGRDLYVHHLQNAVIEAQGDVHINSSSIHSSICCNGKVLAKIDKGTIVGGTVNTLEGVDAKTVGSSGGTKTRIIAGNDFLVQKTIEEIDKVIDFYRTSIKKIENVLRPLLASIKKGTIVSKEKKRAVVLIIDKRRKMKKQLAVMEKKRLALEKQLVVDIHPTVRVCGIIYPDVIVKIKNAVKNFGETSQHVTLYFNAKEDCISLKPYVEMGQKSFG